MSRTHPRNFILKMNRIFKSAGGVLLVCGALSCNDPLTYEPSKVNAVDVSVPAPPAGLSITLTDDVDTIIAWGYTTIRYSAVTGNASPVSVRLTIDGQLAGST